MAPAFILRAGSVLETITEKEPNSKLKAGDNV